MNKLTGMEVKITFLDHSIKRKKDKTKLPPHLTCIVWGKVISETKKSLKICHWDLKVTDNELRYANQEFSNILKADIIKIESLCTLFEVEL